MRKFTADFETTTDPDDCRVWAFATCEIGDFDNFEYGNDIYDFFAWCANPKENYKVYFHNLRFDGEFIIWALLDAGFEWIESKKEHRNNTFTTLVTDMGAWYSIEIYFEVKGHHTNKVTIYDSLKILNFSVEQIAKDFNLPISKLELDYKAKREYKHELTRHEIDYIRNDVEIMARALDFMFKQGLDAMTIGSDALSDFKKRCVGFRNYFPILPDDIDAFVRQSYKGGFTYLCEGYREKTTGAGVVFDINSAYPAALRHQEMPIGYPEPFDGKYEEDVTMPLYVQMLTCRFKVKENHLPSIQLKHTSSFMPNEYITDSGEDPQTLVLTSPDLELFFKQYDVEVIEYNGGFKFKSVAGLFNSYIDHWTEEKIKSKKEKNGALTRTAKLMLNSLYGKFGLNPHGAKKMPVLGIDGALHQMQLAEEERKSIYVPVAAFTTAYVRKFIVESGQTMREWTQQHKGMDGMVYFDTDSMHVTGIDANDVEELAKDLWIDDYALGAWKLESTYVKGKYLRQKCYMEQWPDGTMNVTVAGLPKKLSHIVNFNNFKIGFSTADFTDEQIGEKGRKLTYMHVKGGVILVDTDFTIK